MSGRDDYWDIEKLVPKKRSSLRPFATEVRVSTHSSAPTLDDTVATRRESDRRLSFGESVGLEPAESESYIPDGGGLIKRVTIAKTADKYDFYESFRRSALLYYDCAGNKCDYAEFYSYMPQYAHMTKAQQSYYLYWRSEVRRGRYIKSDYSYIYLYVYEILNLPDKIPAQEGVKLMCRVWREYRTKLPRLDANMSVWLQDYCLVHRLPCPVDEIRDFISACLRNNVIKEFFLADVTNLTIDNTELLVAYLSDYDWRGGRVMDSVSGNTLGYISTHDDYRREMLSAMRGVILDIWNKRITQDGEKHSLIQRDAFPSSLCTHSVKSRLTVEYISFSGSEDIRREVTGAVRYTENKLRHLLGVKSRLAVKELSDAARKIIDTYFEHFFRIEQKRRLEQSRPAYERLYDVESTALSFEGADIIERASWLTTERLVVDEDAAVAVIPGAVQHQGGHSHDAYDDLSAEEDLAYVNFDGTDTKEQVRAEEAYSTLQAIGSPDTVPSSAGCQDDFALQNNTTISESISPLRDETKRDNPLTEDEMSFLCHIISADDGYTIPPSHICDVYAERINNAFMEIIGDVILEFDSALSVYTIYDDYLEEVNEWLKHRM